MKLDMQAWGEKAKGLLKTASEKTMKAATDVRERADRAAEAVAAKVTELTGRETTATEVKRAAVVVAGTVLVGATAAAVLGAHRGVVHKTLAAGTGGSGLRWGADFESQAARVFAENGGSINYYTPRVDPTGTVYYEPHG